jgi:hypothetical protein
MTSLESLLDQLEERQKVEGQIQLSTNATSLDFLQAIYRDPTQPMQRRMRAAQAAIPFEHPKLAVVVTSREGDLADRLMAALQASQQVIEDRKMMKTIEHEAKPVIETPTSPPDHAKPFASDFKSRFRRL